MKKINIIFVILLCVVAFSSCDSFLDVKPSNQNDAETSIKTRNDAQVMIRGIMRNMTSSSYYGRNMYIYADAKGGDMTIAAQGRSLDGLYVFNHSANSGSYSGFWASGYDNIMQINNLLENIAKIEAISKVENFDDYKGQVLTLRALIYFDLVRLYGKPYNMDKTAWGVPDIVTTLPSNAQPKRATVDQNYARILQDLKEGEIFLEKSKSRNDGYINYYGNKAIQARVYLYMENYTESLKAAEVVIDSKVYTPYTNDKWVASWASEFGSESIFELGIYPVEGDLGNSSLGAYQSRAKHLSTSVLGYFLASNYFLDRLKEDAKDVRWGIMAYDEISKTRLGACYKYLGSTSLSGDGKATKSAVNIKVIRLSEMYLIASEAALLSPTPDKNKAVKYLNEIRKRSPSLALATTANISLDMIVKERSKELYGEGHRFFDMIRLNKSITFDDDTPGLTPSHREKTINRTFYKIILPISQSEINANPAIKDQQNDGY